MSEEAKEITVKVKYDPDKDDTIEVKINPNATVAALEEKVKETLGKFDNVPMGILKFNWQVLNNKNETLEERGIKDGDSVENENRVLIKTLVGQTIYITCDENTTVREFLKKLKGKNLGFSYIKLLLVGTFLQRSTLDQKLLGCQIGKNSINYGATLYLIIPPEENENSDTVFDLNNLEESKNSNLAKVSKTLETDNNVFNLERLDNNPIISLESKKESKNSNYPPFRIIVGIADLLLLAAAVATFLLNIHIVATTVLAVLFLVGGILFFGWNTILPKILPKGCLEKINSGADLGKENEYEIDEKENDKGNNPKEKEEYKGKKKEEEEEDNML